MVSPLSAQQKVDSLPTGDPSRPKVEWLLTARSRFEPVTIRSDSLPGHLGASIAAAGSHRGRNAVLGALIGGVAGVVTCTVISNAIKDSGSGFTTCTGDGYLLFGLGGAGLGALVGALIP
jgi:hypothetical protein